MSEISPSVKLDLKEKANKVRLEYTNSISSTDVFDILNEEVILIRKPFDTQNKFSGFTTLIEDHLLVYINSSYTLGHERFTAAHELYHVLFDREVLLKNKILLDNDSNEEYANYFAIEFLMPENQIKKQYYQKLSEKESVQVKHVIRLQHHFKVSYKAMVKRIFELGLCNKDEYRSLLAYSELDKAKELQDLTKKEGYKLDLIVPSNITSIPQRFIDMVVDNYQSGAISYGRFKSIMEFAGKSVDEMGYETPDEDTK